ncbi:MAG: AraC family transcriptional regulator ligand-binding domain-containing protein [Rhodobacteraceae bacterium]|nr:AraC family transcriptional regulator ligand-binding domain-containing protein [Paracoccaceae bacterium]
MLNLDRYLTDNGHDIVELANEFGFMVGPRDHWQDRYYSLPQYALFLEYLAEKFRDPAFALNWSQSHAAGGMRALYLATRYAPSAFAALKLTEKFGGLGIDLDHCQIDLEGERVIFSWKFSPLVVNATQLNDRFAAVVSSRLRDGFLDRGVTALRVDLMRPVPDSAVPYRRVFGPNVFFEQPRNCLIFSREGMQRANPASDPELFEVLVELCERRAVEGRDTGGFVGFVKHMILSELPSQDLGVDRVARELGMSSRVFQRRLAQEGAKFQELHDDIRCDLARELLMSTQTPISEIAHKLGFSAPGNFTRAAKRWFGVSPNQLRRSLK